MAAIVAPVAVLAPRAVAPKARATRALRATTFNGVKVAQPKVRLPEPGPELNGIAPRSRFSFPRYFFKMRGNTARRNAPRVRRGCPRTRRGPARATRTRGCETRGA
jgi:hypothetical protein